MKAQDVFWKLDALSDRQLLERMGLVLGSSRRLMAELVAHLGEVEERRLHLAAACSSLFAYCLKLGMTEDEAYRRIEVARLARRYPAIFPLLADGHITISSVALLKHYLCDDNQLELLAAVTGKSVLQTRELIAERFPRPDIASSVRKLPERQPFTQPLATPRVEPSAAGPEPGTGVTELSAAGAEPGAEPHTLAAQRPQSRCMRPPRSASGIEPLSAHRYKVQFTAGAELARKLELARDLLRHAQPGGELGVIVERALDLLIESVMRRRFGKKAGPKRPSERAGRSDLVHQREVERDSFAMHGAEEPGTTPRGTEPITTELHTERHVTADTRPQGTGTATTLDTAALRADRRGGAGRGSVCSHLPRSTRRTVVERDGLSCSWVDEHGTRCGSRAWLEYDHHRPRAKGGGSERDNLRLLCRNHNRLAAEREYGRMHVEHAIAERQQERRYAASHVTVGGAR